MSWLSSLTVQGKLVLKQWHLAPQAERYLRTVGILMTAVMEDMMNGDAENDLSINEVGPTRRLRAWVVAAPSLFHISCRPKLMDAGSRRFRSDPCHLCNGFV